MTARLAIWAGAVLWAAAAAATTVERFTPQGSAKGVRQAVAVFSAPMVPFGDLRATAPPFTAECAVAGSGRWIDPRTWAYDFESDLPGGLRCTFTRAPGLRDLAGRAVSGADTFPFDTGGPAIAAARPGDGDTRIDAEQAFVLTLDGAATPDSIAQHAAFEIDGLAQRVGVTVLDEAARAAIVAALPYWLKPSGPFTVLRARQTFPDDTAVRLVWGAGIASPSGVATSAEQVLAFKTRPRFTVELSCQRENAKSGCIPLTDLSLRFSAPVPWHQARAVRLVDADGTARPPVEPSDPAETITWLTFAAPFPASATYTVALPDELRDDAGRALPPDTALRVTFAPYPPLAKFAARFGLLEAEADPALPVTIRNLDPDTRGQELRTTAERPSGWQARLTDLYDRLRGTTVHVERPEEILPWLRRLATARRDRSLFAELPAGLTPAGFTLPQPDGPEHMQVVGLPLPARGLYLVELASPRLGAALLDADQPLYVPAGALVTNLAVHLKWAPENALVWVTTLDAAAPVAGARIVVQQCDGSVLGTAVSDAQGLARFTGLPQPDEALRCHPPALEGFTAIDYQEYYANRALTALSAGLFVTAQTTGDLSFVHSSWDEGIEPWRFNLPSRSWDAPLVAHAILDRALFRAGETVHMKLVLRAQTMDGFGAVAAADRPAQAVVRHLGSDERFELPLTWDAAGLAEATWAIPASAKLGGYDVQLPRPGGGSLDAGSFRVEQFRVPLMKATVQLPAAPLVAATTAPVDVAVQYLAGGAAAALPVQVRAQVRERALPRDEAFEDFLFANGPVTVGVERASDASAPADATAVAPGVQQTRSLVLDAAGTGRTELTALPAVTTPRELLVEAEYRDPNGEVQTAAARAPLWPAALIPGLAVRRWSGDAPGSDAPPSLEATVAVLDTALQPVAGAAVQVDAFTRRTYSHRTRVVGGFYTYEHVEETAPAGALCGGTTDAQGRFACRAAAPARGEIVLQATVRDGDGRAAAAHASAWVPGDADLGFAVTASDRMDVLPERRAVEPGETARLQVRMPFRRATALVTVEREGIGAARVVPLAGDAPVVEVPVEGAMAPNAFVSVLAVRGRVAGTQPTAMLDLGKPAFRLGIAELRVGWRAHTLQVTVSPEREAYRVRDTAEVAIAVRTADGAPPPAGSEVALAAVDEGLLELAPNPSWNLLAAMMGRRGYEITTATAQLQVIGKRHFGRKALPSGGGGGRQTTRELFETLLLWTARVPLDAAGAARVSVPLNDSLTAFRLVAVATGGLGLFGSGAATIRATQELMLLSGVPPLVREGDTFPAQFTVRNTTAAPLQVGLAGLIEPDGGADPIALPPQGRTLAAGEAAVVAWPVTVPAAAHTLRYTITAEAGGTSDRLAATQQVRPAVPVRTLQATLVQLDGPRELPVAPPRDALPGRGGVEIALAASLGGSTAGVADYLRRYPYTCLEQQVSIAVGLGDAARWDAIAAALPSYLDGDGLLKFFPTLPQGSEVLTAYVLSIAHAAGWSLPAAVQEKVVAGLQGFVAGSVRRDSPLRAPDLTLRKLAALAALARAGAFEPAQLDSLTIEPLLWPTAALLDWWEVLQRTPSLPGRDANLATAERLLRARLSVQGSVTGFADEGGDHLWWLLASPDQNAVRLVLHLVEFGLWRDEVPRLLRGALARQRRGHWDTTLANAWGALALARFAAAYEATPVTGRTAVALGESAETLAWSDVPPPPARLPWPPAAMPLSLAQQGSGAPWATIASRAAIPLTAPLAAGYRIAKTVTPLEPQAPGTLRRGDRLRVRLDVEADADMTWVVFDDPIPAGASHLGSGLGTDSQLGAAEGAGDDLAVPDFVERRFDAYRAYFQFLPQGRSSVEYVVRLNQDGRFALPPTRVEALYAPEMFGETPNAPLDVAP